MCRSSCCRVWRLRLGLEHSRPVRFDDEICGLNLAPHILRSCIHASSTLRTLRTARYCGSFCQSGTGNRTILITYRLLVDIAESTVLISHILHTAPALVEDMLTCWALSTGSNTAECLTWIAGALLLSGLKASEHTSRTNILYASPEARLTVP